MFRATAGRITTECVDVTAFCATFPAG